MQKIILWVAVGLVIIGGGYFALTSSKGSSTNSAQESTTAEPSGKKMAFSEFLKSGEASKCSVTQSVSGLETKGTVYAYKGMMKGEFNTEAYGKTIQTDFVLRDGYTYTWTSAAPSMGFKVTVATPAGANVAPASGQIGFNAETIGDYDCQPWTVDESKFTLPSSVTFKEIGA